MLTATPDTFPRAAWSDLWAWYAKHGDKARTLYPQAEAAMRVLERHQQAEQARPYIVNTRERRELLAELQEQLTDDLAPQSARRAAEHHLADYIEKVYSATGALGLPDVVDKLRSCRMRGTVGLVPGGGHVVAWDDKCGMVRLCPDEAREETQRLAKRYVPAITTWRDAKPTRRVHYAVFTRHNWEPGRLAYGKRRDFEDFKALLSLKYRSAPLKWVFDPKQGERGGWGWERTRKRTLTAFPSIKGAFVVQEDPLSARDDWNTHLNVLLLTEGPIDYGELRQEWGGNIEIRELPRAKGALTRAIIELVKYAAQHTPTKSAAKSARHATEAPAMTEWPPARWLEWWEAQQGFRRTRSYGCLYGVELPEPEKLDMDSIEWVGSVLFDSHGAGYRVDLIPGHNSEGSRSDRGRYGAPGGAHGPPGRELGGPDGLSEWFLEGKA